MARRRHSSSVLAFVVAVFLVQLSLFGCASQPEQQTDVAQTSEEQTTQPTDEQSTTEQAFVAETSEEDGTSDEVDFHDLEGDYTLEKVVVLSRHNIRAPLSTNGSVLALLTPHTWYQWTAAGSELSLRGGVLEYEMGQYFRRWLEHEELIPSNWQPADGEARFYANAKQRTIATTRSFSAGMLPVAPVVVETHAPYDTMDPVFNPCLTFMTDSYREAAIDDMVAHGGASSIEEMAKDAADSFALITEVCDFEESEGFKSGEYGPLDTKDVSLTLELGKEPATKGSLRSACQLSDALVLQYYEEPDPVRAAFGHELSFEDWKCISKAKDTFIDLLYTAPLISANIAHPLLEEIESELGQKDRVFTFLCGHDSNIASVLAALDVEPYELEGSIEAGTPIGCKVVFEQWQDGAGEEYGRVRMVYANSEQLREASLLVGDNQPMSCELSFEGLEKNDDGLFDYAELTQRVADAADDYYELEKTYQDQANAA